MSGTGTNQGSDLMRRIKEERMRFQEAIDGAKAVSTAGGKDLMEQVVPTSSHVPPLMHIQDAASALEGALEMWKGQRVCIFFMFLLCLCLLVGSPLFPSKQGRTREGRGGQGRAGNVGQEEGWWFKDNRKSMCG